MLATAVQRMFLSSHGGTVAQTAAKSVQMYGTTSLIRGRGVVTGLQEGKAAGWTSHRVRFRAVIRDHIEWSRLIGVRMIQTELLTPGPMVHLGWGLASAAVGVTPAILEDDYGVRMGGRVIVVIVIAITSSTIII